MYRKLTGVFLAAASLCFSWETQAAGLLENLTPANEISLYERVNSGEVRIGDRIYQMPEYHSLQDDLNLEEAKKDTGQKRQIEQQDQKEQEYIADQREKTEQNKEEAQGKSLSKLQGLLEGSVRGYAGNWEIYVKDLKTGNYCLTADKSVSSASLIKTFVMAGVYEQVEKGILQEDTYLKELLDAMITVSDNDAYNELVSTLGSGDFLAGCQVMNQYLQEQGYSHTGVHHTLSPSKSVSMGDGQSNMTSVGDCGKLLERIYRGECVSEEASDKMLNLLLGQQTDWKIPAGVPEEIQVANKSGETDTCQHDIAIVYGPKTTYILCIMSDNLPDEDTGIQKIQELSSLVYEYFLEAEDSE